MRNSTKHLLAIAALLTLVPGGAAAEDAPALTEAAPAPEEATPESEAETKPWGVAVNVGTSTGTALFHPTPYVRGSSASVTTSLGATGTYKVADEISARASLGFALDATPTLGGGDPNTCIEGVSCVVSGPDDASGRRLYVSDPSVGISHASLYEDEAFTGLNLSGGATLSLGLGTGSRFTSKIAGLGLSLSAGRSFLDDKLSLSYSLGGGLTWFRYTSPTARVLSRDLVNMCIAENTGKAPAASRCVAGGLNAPLSLSNTLAGSYTITDTVSVSMSLGLMHSFRYAPKKDALTTPAVDGKGNPIVRCSGLCASDAIVSSVGVSYSLGDGYALGATLATGQAPFGYGRFDPNDSASFGGAIESNVKKVHFPFWDPDLLGNSFSISASGSF